MTTKALRERLSYWQRRMRLQDFDIQIKFVTPSEIGQGVVGRCRPDWKNGQAMLEILNPKYNKINADGFQNIDLTIVHELTHLLLWPIQKWDDDEESLERQLLEQVVEKISKGLLDI